MNSSLLSLVRYRQLTVERQAGDGEFYRQGHEHRGRVVDQQRGGQREP